MEQDWRYSMACPTDTQLLWLGSLKYGWSTVSSKNPPHQAITPWRMSQTQLGEPICGDMLDTLEKRVEDVETSLLMEELRQLTLVKKHRELVAKASGNGVTSCVLCGEDFYMFSLCWIVRITSCPSLCHDCHNKVCSKCKRQYMLKHGQVSLCAMCHSRRQLWKDTGAWYLGYHSAFDMADDELSARLNQLQMELLTEESTDLGDDSAGLTQTAPKNNDVELYIQIPTPRIELTGIGHLLDTHHTSLSPQTPPPPGKLFTFKRQMSRSLPSLNISASDSELTHIAEEPQPVYERQLSSPYAVIPGHKSLTLPLGNKRSSWFGSTDSLQDVRHSLDVSLPRSVARLVGKTPSHASMASLTDRSDSEITSHGEEDTDEKEISPTASAHNDPHESSLEESGSEQQPAQSPTQRLEDAQERRRNYYRARKHSLTKFVKKAEDLIKSFSSNASPAASRETSPDSNGTIEFSMVYDRDSMELRVTILRCKGLRAADSNGLSDPYVNVYLSEGSATKQNTAVVERTLNPVFDQEFVYHGISESFIRRHELIFIVFDHDKVSKDDFLGSATIPIRRVKHDVDAFCLSLTDQYPGNVAQYRQEDGQALVSIGYSLEKKTINVGVLRVVRLRPANNKKLSANPYAKVILSNVDGEVSRKTAVHQLTLNPEFKEEFEFPLEGMKLDKMGLRICVSHRSRTNRTTHLCEANLDGLLYQALKSKSAWVQEWIELKPCKH